MHSHKYNKNAHDWIANSLGDIHSFTCNSCDYVIMVSPNHKFLSYDGIYVDQYHLIIKPGLGIIQDPDQILENNAPQFLDCNDVQVRMIMSS